MNDMDIPILAIPNSPTETLRFIAFPKSITETTLTMGVLVVHRQTEAHPKGSSVLEGQGTFVDALPRRPPSWKPIDKRFYMAVHGH